MSEQYSKREIELMVTGVRESMHSEVRHVDAMLNSRLDQIDQRTKRTEQTVNGLPGEFAELKNTVARIEATVKDDHAPWTRTQKLAAFFGASGALGTLATIVISLSRGGA